jgi:hypothetical protein
MFRNLGKIIDKEDVMNYIAEEKKEESSNEK